MSDIYKKIIKENSELKETNSLDEIFSKLHLYLKDNFKICDFKILISKNHVHNLLYESSKEIHEHEYRHKTKIKIKISSDIKIIFKIYSKNNDSYEFIENKKNEIKLILDTLSQILYIKYLELEINKLSLTDKVTGLHNRHYLDNYVDNILSISNREQKKVAFLKVSIDKFKAVIDEFDYAIGDDVLKALADAITTTVRSSDIALKFESGDFLIILLNVINEDNARMISEKIINNFSEKEILVNPTTNQTLMKTACVGIALYPDDATNIDDIIKKADIALYEAKNKGRSQVYKYTEEVNTIDFF